MFKSLLRVTQQWGSETPPRLLVAAAPAHPFPNAFEKDVVSAASFFA